MDQDNPFFDLDDFPTTPAPETCHWCNAPLDGEAVVDLMLTAVFGYVYCSEECRHAHVNSK